MFEEALQEGAEEGPDRDASKGDDRVCEAACEEARPVGLGVGVGREESEGCDPDLGIDPLETDRTEKTDRFPVGPFSCALPGPAIFQARKRM